MSMQKASGWLAIKKNEIISRYGNGHSFALAFNPSVQLKCAMHIEKSLMGNVPTIRQLMYAYQMEQVQVWLIAHLEDLNEYVGVKSKMSMNQMRELANMLIVRGQYLKASEVLLFFHKLKGGDFGSFYGTVDPQVVGESFLAFMKWRSQELTKLHYKQAQEEQERKRSEWKEKAITREEYERRRVMKEGD